MTSRVTSSPKYNYAQIILEIINQESGGGKELKVVLWRKVLAVERQSLIVHGCTPGVSSHCSLSISQLFIFVFIYFLKTCFSFVRCIYVRRLYRLLVHSALRSTQVAILHLNF